MAEKKVQNVDSGKAQGKAKASKKSNSRNQDVSVPYFTQKVTLDSEQAQRAYRRSFGVASKSFTQLSIILRIIGSEKDAIAVEKIVDAELSAVAKELKEERDRLKAVLKDGGIDGQPSFSKPQEFEVKIFSPRASRYLMLIRELDSLMAKVTLLWLSGELSDGHYTKIMYEWQQRFMALSGFIRTQASRAINSANRKEDKPEGAPEDDQKKAKPSVGGKKKAAAKEAKEVDAKAV